MGWRKCSNHTIVKAWIVLAVMSCITVIWKRRNTIQPIKDGISNTVKSSLLEQETWSLLTRDIVDNSNQILSSYYYQTSTSTKLRQIKIQSTVPIKGKSYQTKETSTSEAGVVRNRTLFVTAHINGLTTAQEHRSVTIQLTTQKAALPQNHNSATPRPTTLKDPLTQKDSSATPQPTTLPLKNALAQDQRSATSPLTTPKMTLTWQKNILTTSELLPTLRSTKSLDHIYLANKTDHANHDTGLKLKLMTWTSLAKQLIYSPEPETTTSKWHGSKESNTSSSQADTAHSVSTEAVLKRPLILLYTAHYGKRNWWFHNDDRDFSRCDCKCTLTANRNMSSLADMSVFHTFYRLSNQKGETYSFWGDTAAFPQDRPSHQVWMLFSQESQPRGLSGEDLQFLKYSFNYTTTFQQSADVIYDYGHVVNRSISLTSLPNYAESKVASVLWVVSNCYAKKRLHYYEELKAYINISMFGECGKAADPCKRDEKCSKTLRTQHRFYLAFENSECRDYITEKFWNSLRDETVPIVMGPPRRDYEKVAPIHSFIHVNDFLTPKHLADYLKVLENNATLYNQYHEWRKSLDIVDWPRKDVSCEMCRLATEKPKQIRNIVEDWNADKQCV